MRILSLPQLTVAVALLGAYSILLFLAAPAPRAGVASCGIRGWGGARLATRAGVASCGIRGLGGSRLRHFRAEHGCLRMSKDRCFWCSHRVSVLLLQPLCAFRGRHGCKSKWLP